MDMSGLCKDLKKFLKSTVDCISGHLVKFSFLIKIVLVMFSNEKACKCLQTEIYQPCPSMEEDAANFDEI